MSNVTFNSGQKQYKNQFSALFADYDIFGGVDLLGSLKKNFNEDAIKNSLRTWFGSKFGERYRNPNSGGIFFQQVGKGMGDERLARLQSRCMRDLDTDYEGLLSVVDLSFTPNKELKFLEVSITVSSPFIKGEVSDVMKIRLPK